MSIKVTITNMYKDHISRNKLILLGLILIIGVSIFFVSSKKSQRKNIAQKKVTIVASFYPLAFLAQRIGGEYVEVVNLTPAGAEPHDFEPSTRDIVELEKQDIILLNGGGLEEYAEKIKANINVKKTTLIKVGESLMSNPIDPHVWLDPILYKKEAEIIANVLIQKDPQHSKIYIENVQKLMSELELLNSEFTKGLSNCKQSNIVTSHKAFGYLANRYNLHEIALTGLSPEEEPSSQALAEISTFAKKNKIGYIFFEELVSPAIAETIANEIGAKTLVFNPLEGLTKEDVAAGKTYVTVQKENLKNLQIALECK